MGVNKVVYGTTTIIDISDSTAAADKMLKDIVAYGANGDKVTGNIETKTDLSVSGAKVTAPKGYYADDATTTIPSVSGSIGGSASSGKATAAISNVNNIATVSSPTGTAGTDYFSIKATAIGTAGSYTPEYTVSKAGYIGSTVTGTAQTVSVTGDSTGKTLHIPKAKFEASGKSIKTTSSGGGYIPANTTVGTVSDSYIIPSGTKTITTNGTHDVSSYESATVNVAGEDVTEETNAYTELNAELEEVINSLPNAGGGSGGSVETCNIAFSYITNSMLGLNTICYTKLGVNGLELEIIYADAYQNYTIELENVVCNSIIVISLEAAFPKYEVSSNIMDLESESSFWLGNGHALLPISSGNGTITVYNDWK